MTARARLRRIVVPLAVLGAASLVALLIAELAVRLVAPQQLVQIRPDLWQPMDTIGYQRRPNVAVKINTGERDVMIYTDADGYRVGREGRRDAPVRVLLLGDSFIEALQVEHEQSVAHLLEAQLSEQLGKDVVVRSAGVGGWNPNHYLIEMRRAFTRERFDLVVVAVFVGNDAIEYRTNTFRRRAPVELKQFRLPRRLAPSEFVDALLAPVNDLLEPRSHLFVLLKSQTATLRMRLGLSAVYLPPEYLRSEQQSARWSNTGEILHSIDSTAKSHGAAALFALVPERFQVYAADFNQYVRGFGIDTSTVDLEQPSRLLAEEIGRIGLSGVDALPLFRQVADTSAPLFGRVDAHLSPLGHELLAAIVRDSAAAALRR